MSFRRLGVVAVTALALTSPAVAFGAPVLYTSDFIADSSRSGFNGFESIGPANWSGDPYSEQGITVETVAGLGGDRDIWTSYRHSGAHQGAYSWYHNGGDHGFSRITLAGGAEFEDLGLLVGSGWGATTFAYFNYQTLLNGVVTSGGSLWMAPGYLGFGGGGFDELRLSATQVSASPSSGAYQALAIDSVEIRNVAVPEPGSLLMLGIGLFAVTLGARRNHGEI